MGIENIKRWQWVIVGALVGLAMSYVWTSLSTDIESNGGGSPEKFELAVIAVDPETTKPLVTDIVVHPPVDTYKGKANIVTFKRMAKDKEGRVGWLDEHIVADIPYKPTIDRGLQVTDIKGNVLEPSQWTIDRYLAALSTQFPTIKYHYGWWLTPKNAMVLGSIGGVLVIGGLWPSLLNLIIGAGFGKAPEPKSAKKDRPLSSYKSRPEPEKVKAGMTAEDEARLAAVTAAYEQNVGPGSGVSSDDSTAGAVAVPTEVRKLEGGPVEAAAPLKQPGDDDDIEVKGEFYPVLIHHKKEDKKDSADQKSPPNSPPPPKK